METSAEYFRSDVPAGRSGAWAVEKVSIPAREYDPAADPRPDCFKFRPGVYTCLRRDATQFMTDLYDEWWTQQAGVAEALARGGEVLITGLGLGLVAEAMLRPVGGRIEQPAGPGQFGAAGLEFFTQRSAKVRLIVGALIGLWAINSVASFWIAPSSTQVSQQSGISRRSILPKRQGFWPKTYLEALAGP